MPTGTVSGSAQLATAISGSFTALSASLACRITSGGGGGGSDNLGSHTATQNLNLDNNAVINASNVSGSATSTGSFGNVYVDETLEIGNGTQAVNISILGPNSNANSSKLSFGDNKTAGVYPGNNGVSFRFDTDANKLILEDEYNMDQAGTRTLFEVPRDGNFAISGSSTSTGSFGAGLYDGNVGLGIKNVAMTDPTGGSRTLHIHKDGSDSAAALRFTTGDTGTALQDGLVLEYWDGAAYLWNYENTSLGFATNNTTRMTIAAGGDITMNNGLIVTNNITANGNIVGDNGTIISGINTICLLYTSPSPRDS